MAVYTAPTNLAGLLVKWSRSMTLAGSSTAAPRPTTGQLWPRVKRNG